MIHIASEMATGGAGDAESLGRLDHPLRPIREIVNASCDKFGTPDDPLVGKQAGGTITYGGGVGLYQGKTAVGGLGLSGDTACADHLPPGGRATS